MIQKSYNNTPSIYIIPTPIGNLRDITLRAIDVLNFVDIIFCEDTRITSELLKELKISKKLIHSDDHNELVLKEKALEILKLGKNIGIVTDRGTPLISDPGYGIVEYIVENGYNVISLPGPTAFVPALNMSGLSPQPFLFYGFLGNKASKREKELDELKLLRYTLIFYEAPHRLIDMLNSILKILGDRNIAICREITKKYEEVIRGNVSKILENGFNVKGEFVVVVEGNQNIENFENLSIIDHLNIYLNDGIKKNDAIKIVAKERNISKSTVYNELIKK